MNRAAELRDAFDRSFAQVQNGGEATAEGFVAIRIGGAPYALRLADIAALVADKRITRLPSAVSELLGIATVRGTVLPVFDLGLLLGCPPANLPRWLLVTAAAPVGLAFGELERYLTAPPEAVTQEEIRGGARDPHVREVLQTEIARPVIHLLSVLETVKSLGDHNSRPRQTRSEER